MASRFPIPYNLSHEQLPNHADPASVPLQTAYLGLRLLAYRRRVSLGYPSPFHELIPRFWIHQAWRPFTP